MPLKFLTAILSIAVSITTAISLQAGQTAPAKAFV
jgi:hypothetical protein